MKIRLQITLWMMGVGCASILIFVFFVYTELREAYVEMAHTEAQHLAKQVAVELESLKGPELLQRLRRISAHDWIRVETSGGKLFFLSDAARKMPLALPARGQSLTVADRAYVLAYPAGDVTVYAAWKMDTLVEEMQEMQWVLIGGLLLAIVFLGGSSYWVAARILQPVRKINHLAHAITAQRLDQRIPLQRSRDELYELSQALNQMFDRLEDGIKQQRQFLSDASHELKTPTTMLRLFLEQLDQHPDLPEDLRNRLQAQTHGLLRMERLIKQLLELSVFESREQLPLEALALGPLLQDLCAEFAPLLEVSEIQLQSDLPSELRMLGHAESLRRMLICLLENAIVYNVPGGRLEMRGKQMGRELVLEIRNTGPGIPAEDLPHVFERFYRVDKSRSQSNSGSGLGLAIVHQIVRLHQGSIIAESQGEWTCLRLRFPAMA